MPLDYIFKMIEGKRFSFAVSGMMCVVCSARDTEEEEERMEMEMGDQMGWIERVLCRLLCMHCLSSRFLSF
jgi:hypothetical protein